MVQFLKIYIIYGLFSDSTTFLILALIFCKHVCKCGKISLLPNKVSTNSLYLLTFISYYLQQEIDLRYAVPFGFYHAALNFGVSGGVIFPWGNGFLNKPSSLPERFFLGGDFSPVCTLGGPATVWGFKTRGLGPTEPRRHIRDNSNQEVSVSSGRDFIGGDLAVSAFADISFDLPLRWLRERGVHGHVFAGAGNVAKLSENEFRKFSFQRFFESFRSSVGAGIVIPTKIFRLEVSCIILFLLFLK